MALIKKINIEYRGHKPHLRVVSAAVVASHDRNRKSQLKVIKPYTPFYHDKGHKERQVRDLAMQLYLHAIWRSNDLRTETTPRSCVAWNVSQNEMLHMQTIFLIGHRHRSMLSSTKPELASFDYIRDPRSGGQISSYARTKTMLSIRIYKRSTVDLLFLRRSAPRHGASLGVVVKNLVAVFTNGGCSDLVGSQAVTSLWLAESLT